MKNILRNTIIDSISKPNMLSIPLRVLASAANIIEET